MGFSETISFDFLKKRKKYKIRNLFQKIIKIVIYILEPFYIFGPDCIQLGDPALCAIASTDKAL